MSAAAIELRIRRMTVADLDRVMAIARSLRRAPQWPRSVYEAALNPRSTLKRIALLTLDTATGTVIGFTVARLAPPEAELETIAVASRFQRRGVAQQLFRELAFELRLAQVNEVLLEVRMSNLPAQALYRSLGFVEAGWRPRYYTEPVEDAVLMRFMIA